jgi:hypothetical protein
MLVTTLYSKQAAFVQPECHFDQIWLGSILPDMYSKYEKLSKPSAIFALTQ